MPRFSRHWATISQRSTRGNPLRPNVLRKNPPTGVRLTTRLPASGQRAFRERGWSRRNDTGVAGDSSPRRENVSWIDSYLVVKYRGVAQYLAQSLAAAER